MSNTSQNIDAKIIDTSINLLNQYVKDESIGPLLSALEALKNDPQNESLFENLSEVFNSLGIVQGAVLTYAPYLSKLFSENLFEGDWE